MTSLRATRFVAAALACAVAAVAAGAPRVRDASPPTSPGKPTAPLTIDFALRAEPAVGTLLAISIEVRAPADVRDLAIEARAADAQALLVAAQAPVPGKPGAWTVTVLPLVEATSYLSVAVHGTLGGSPQTRSVAIPVRAGGDKGTARALEAIRPPVADGGRGERLILLPATEGP